MYIATRLGGDVVRVSADYLTSEIFATGLPTPGSVIFQGPPF